MLREKKTQKNYIGEKIEYNYNEKLTIIGGGMKKVNYKNTQ